MPVSIPEVDKRDRYYLVGNLFTDNRVPSSRSEESFYVASKSVDDLVGRFLLVHYNSPTAASLLEARAASDSRGISRVRVTDCECRGRRPRSVTRRGKADRKRPSRAHLRKRQRATEVSLCVVGVEFKRKGVGVGK